MTAIGAIIGLILSILLIIKKVHPFYSLILGALAGGLLGTVSLPDTVRIMIEGIKDITPAVIRILTAGVLSGVLIITGAAESISNHIIKFLGEKYVYLALALSAMLLCTTGVFIDVAIITVAPIALLTGRNLGIHPSKLLLIMIGGGKCGNIISPNPNTIIAAENFGADLYSVMVANLIPAIIGLIVTVTMIVKIFPDKKYPVKRITLVQTEESVSLPSFGASIIGPVVTILLLALRPLAGLSIDPLIALPVGGIIGIICMRKISLLKESLEYGLSKMSVIAVLLIGTGAIAGIIKHSSLKDYMISGLAQTPFGEYLIAPLSGALMSAATASTTAGATIASSSFSSIIVALGVSAVWGAAMINSGATVLDHLPHGSFFHATGGSMEVGFKERMKLIPYETLIGTILATLTTFTYIVLEVLMK